MKPQNLFRDLAQLGFAALMCTAAAKAAPVLQVTDGQLTGAKGVVVNDKSYDVSFAGGTCADAFKICQPALFLFTDIDMARAASLALSEQVFVNSAVGDFDKYSNLTKGCEAYVYHCFVFTPASIDGTSVIGSSLLNYSGGARDDIYRSFYNYADAASVKVTYARWSTPVAEIPEPGTNALLLIALGGIGAIRLAKRMRK
jgi:hypothetical protein